MHRTNNVQLISIELYTFTVLINIENIGLRRLHVLKRVDRVQPNVCKGRTNVELASEVASDRLVLGFVARASKL